MSTLLRRAVLASVLTVGGLAFTSESKAQGFGIGYGSYGPYGSGFNLSVGSGAGFFPGYGGPGYYGGYRPVVRPVPVPVIVPQFGYRPPYGGFPYGGGYGGGYGRHCHRPYPSYPY